MGHGARGSGRFCAGHARCVDFWTYRGQRRAAVLGASIGTGLGRRSWKHVLSGGATAAGRPWQTGGIDHGN